ncbi:hypothetical protein C8A00DRAFT_13025 [Chaetomidium leptoderma]|uniref:Uncharacterized protein n=1 Tax=Chaetomidium leptoderma TaxID=669021 RepID=A0AAN6VTI3_9PEZI|nr:hypothetical protein C8A00DRAFT_13025 [Chaetomidium leptoderma]
MDTLTIPNLKSPREKKNFFMAIMLVSLSGACKPALEIDLTPDELQELVKLVNAMVTFDNSNSQAEPNMDIATEVGWKTIRFFSALLLVMLEGPPYPCNNIIAFAHTRLISGIASPDIRACARAMKPLVVHKAMNGIVNRRRASLKQEALAASSGVVHERRRPSEPDLSECERAAKRQEMLFFYSNLDLWIKLVDEKERMESEPAPSPPSDWSFEMD